MTNKYFKDENKAEKAKAIALLKWVKKNKKDVFKGFITFNDWFVLGLLQESFELDKELREYLYADIKERIIKQEINNDE